MRTDRSEPLLALRGLTKSFGPFKANDSVDLDVAPGEIHALLGENGAGKSTLVKILYGALQPDAGTIRWTGRDVHIPSPAAARRLGIGMVFQHFSLFEALTVAENVAVALPGQAGLSRLSRDIEAVSSQYGLPLRANARVYDLSVGERQRIEIVRCLLQNPDLIIMDEPTSVLTPHEAEDLFAVLRQLADEGRAILYISHKLEEVRALCQSATILRHGKVVETCTPAEETAASIARMMVGSDIPAVSRPASAHTGSDPLVAVNALSLPAADAFGIALEDLSLSVRAGEIAGIAGIAGNGQTELFDVLAGERLAPDPQSVTLMGEAVGRKSIFERRRLDAVFISEERLGHATVPTLALSENVVLTRHGIDKDLLDGPLINRARARNTVAAISKAFDVRKSTPDPVAQSLSGGNLQKFIMGREVLGAPKVVVVNQPTWGVDAGSAARIRQALIDLAAEGAAILVISQDLDELFEICDRLAAIAHGRLSDFTPTARTDRHTIGLKMTGAFETAESAA